MSTPPLPTVDKHRKLERHRESEESAQETLIFAKKYSPRRTYASVQTTSDYVMAPSDVTLEMTSLRSRTGLMKLVTCVLSVLFAVAMNVTLPILAGTMQIVGGDTFCVLLFVALWFPLVLATMALILKVTVMKSLSFYPTSSWRVYFLVGLCTTLSGVGVVFASPPDRTKPYLQGILTTSLIPFTVLCRFILLRKKISARRVGCTIAVLVGIFITIEPQIWELPGSDASSQGGTTTGHIVWPMIFTLGFLPAAVSNVLGERELKQKESQSFSFIIWTQLFQLLTILPLFWVDFIPFFGMTDSFATFRQHLHNGFTCAFSSAEHCHGLAAKFWMFILSYCFSNLFLLILIQIAEGAVFAVVVQSLVTPIASLFWTFFKFESTSGRFFWDPEFTETTGFTIAGLTIIVPSVVLYNLFSRWDEQKRGDDANGDDEND